MQTQPLFEVVRAKNGAQVGALAVAAAAAKSGNRLDLRDLPKAPQVERPRLR